MRFTNQIKCASCNLKCDIYLTAVEMGLADKFEPIQAVYKKHEVICRQNSSVSHAIVIVEGQAKMLIEGVNQKNIIMYILVPSDYIGLIGVYDIKTYAYSVAAISECYTCQIDINFVKELYFSNSNFLKKLNFAFGASVNSIMEKLISLNQKQIRGRVADSLLYLSKIYDATSFTLGITRKELGEMSAISEENAVRLLSEFKNENIIGFEGKEITIKNLARLKKISEVG